MLQSLSFKPTALQGNFFQAGDFQALPILDEGYKQARLKQGIVSASIEPSDASAKEFDIEDSSFEIESVEVGNLEFSAL